jgi:nucleotide-binding universal stress UspA family protein
MKKILLATDFSDDASNAFEFSILLTQKCHGELLIVHTYTPPYVDAATPIAMIDTMQKEMVESYQKKLDKMVNTAIEIGVSTTSELIIGSVAAGVETTVDEKDIDYLVIGKTGDTGFLAKLVGNNTTDIIDSVKIPTFVIPRAERFSASIKQMLYGTQLEFDELSQLSTAFSLAKLFDAELSLVHVKAPNEMDIRDDETFLKDIRSTFVNEEALTIEIIKADSVVKGVKSAISLFQSDILVVSSHNRSFLSQLFNSSTSQSLVDSVNIPVLILNFEDID